MQINIEIHTIAKIYGRTSQTNTAIRALSEVSLSVAPSEIFALIGPNGAGKSTLVKILLGLVRATSGTAFILGKPVADPAARQSVGYLPENMHYPPALTPRAFLFAAGGLHGMSNHELPQRIAQVLNMLDMEQWSRTPFRKFSKGMLQRIGLAQALLHDPQVLFLDEPSDGLDPIGRKDFRELLKRLRGEGKTIFMNSHLLSEVEMVADRIAVIKNGVIIKTGLLAEIVPPAEGFLVTMHAPLPPDLHDVLSLYPMVSAGDTATVEVPGPADLERLLSALKARGLAAEAIVPRKSTLEDSFLALMKGPQ